ncbi:MAG: restriction endonuclease subunit S [Paludibacteraceae bacterium]|nr:restriction endonuclease subunit S [Paludibacteraceae bacterium]
MKENWTYKKFEDCLEKVKNTPKLQSSDYLSNGIYPIVSQEESLISGYWNEEADVFKIHKPIVIFGDHTRVLKYVDFDFVLGADGVKILQPINALSAKFLFYYLQWCKIPSLGYSRHYKLLKDISVPIPPTGEQSRIVSELDLLQSIIDKQQAQLKELDTLAQAVFYDMFGDPVENEKGWEVKRLGEVATFKNGLNYSPNETGKKYHIIGVSDFQMKSEISCNNELTTIYANDTIDDGYLLQDNDILFVRSNGNKQLIARNILVKTNNLEVTFSGFCIRARITNGTALPFYINSLLKLPSSHKALTMSGRGCNISNLNQTTLNDFPIILPPLPLQQSFAAKIEAIEKQKAAISQSIAETQKLFDYTMDKYFG